MSLIDNETAKPVVFYKESAFVEVGKRAALFGTKGHPRLGDSEVVHTSTVLNVSADGTIETRNTVYKLLEE